MKKLFVLLALSGAVQIVVAANAVGDVKASASTGPNVAICIGCHAIPGYKASYPEVFPVPLLGGQSAQYIENALKAYQKGDRKHPTMRSIAASLTDKDIAELAAYYSKQK